jgi:hypothetical protein
MPTLPETAPPVNNRLRLPQLAAYYGKDERTIKRWNTRYKLPRICIGNHLEYDLAEVEAHLKALRSRGGAR